MNSIINYSIRRATLNDALAIHEAHMRSINEICSKDHTAEEIAGWGNRPFDEFKRINAIENHFVWVVIINDKIEGYAELRLNEKDGLPYALIFGLYLTLKANGFGIGSELLKKMIQEAHKQDATCISLESTLTALHFYQKHGFQSSGSEAKVQIGGSLVRCYPMSLKIFRA